MPDTLHDRLRSAVDRPGDAEVERALASVTGTVERRRRRAAVAGVLASAAVVVGAVVAVQATAGEDDPGPEDLATVGPEEPAGMPWAPSTTGPPDSLSDDELAVIRDEVLAMAASEPPDESPLYSAGIGTTEDGTHVVAVDLRADAVALADQVWERFAPNVRITVGYRYYPSGEPVEGVECPAGPPAAELPGIEAELVLDEAGPVRSGADVAGTLVIRNTTDADIAVMTNEAGTVVEEGTGTVVGVSTMARTAMATSERVPAGGEARVEVQLGTTNCRPEGPPGLPAGRYEALVALPASVGEVADPASPAGAYVTARAPLTIE